MIYTIGNTTNYNQFFIDQERPQKLGRCSYSPGGSVWRTFDEAQKYLNGIDSDEFSIYGVIADWEKDTIQGEGKGWHDLLKNADLVKLK